MKTWWDCIKANMESFGLSREDAQDRDYWRLRIKGEPANPGLPGKGPLKRCVCVCVCVMMLVTFLGYKALKYFTLT